MNRKSATACLLVLAAVAGAFLASCDSSHTGAYRYLLHVPENRQLANNERLPVLIFLHGSGEAGTDIEAVKKHGPPMLIAQGRKLPFVVISPQLDERRGWDNSRLEKTLLAATQGRRIDTSRIYLTGLSLGGFGTWSWAMERPKLFAAIAPIASSGNVANACALKDTPTWAFHGARDDAVSPSGSIKMIKAIEACGGHPRLTVYPEEGHWSWVPAYNNPELYDWLIQHQNPNGATEYEKLKTAASGQV